MEGGVGRSERRGRKRRRKDVQNVEVDQDGKKRAVGLKPKALVGRYVRKEFEGNGLFLGKVMYYDSGLYRVDYDDGDCEDLDIGELKEVLVEDDELVGEWLDRKKKLNEMVASSEVKDEPISSVADKIEEVPVSCDLGNDCTVKLEKTEADIDANSLSDLSEDDEDQDLCLEVEKPPLVPAPELPPSSGNIGIPEEYVSYLLSIYSFLRTFSTTLFLSPFGLDDFVGALNCSVPNTLLDSVHVALMRVLRRHLDNLSSDGSEIASKCLRNVDWSLLDTMTWPAYLVHYLTGMGYTDEHDWKDFYPHTLEKEYYSLSAGRKLVVLQILCDSVLDSEELIAEIDMRKESEVGIDSDGCTVFSPVIGPRRVHPRYSKTSACKDQEAIKLSKENSETTFSLNTNSLGSKDSGQDSIRGVDQDDNGDECRLCGMDGTLLCCDGCPSSYHGRCIGVCKMYIPEGAWYCPECTINELEPKITRGTSLKGSEVFGVDPYGQVFMGTCNHLLVLKALAGSDCNVRYYYDKDITKVLQALSANVQHYALYLEICKGIIQYWELPVNFIFPNGELSEIRRQGEGTTGGSLMPSLNSSVTESLGEENTASCVTEIGQGNALLGNLSMEPMQNEKLGVVSRPDGLCLANINSIARQSTAPIDSLPPEQIQVKPLVCTGSVDQQLIPSEWTEQNGPHFVKTAIHTSSHINYLEQTNGNYAGVTVSYGRGCLYMGSSFKPQGYINSYLHGDFAASAAASLAVLSSEENHGSETRVSDTKRKHMSASFLLQAKAFSSVAMRFFWPNTEKKLVEVPRERCSWCLSCKAPVTSKRGCLLNAAASNAIKGAVKILSGLRPAKGGEGSLPGIATYIMLMEESLTGLIGGPFQSEAFRKQWRKQAEQATSCSAIKSLLLELEENIRLVAFSVDWTKLVDGGSSESSITPPAAGAAGSTQKRKPGRRGRKPMAIVEATADESQDILTDFTWWRGGLISKFIFQKGTLPRRMVKKAARQGGVRKIPSIYYAEGTETAKRNRQLVWRAAVDMCRTTSQLALQVRYLDMHLRWTDLVRPEQSVQDGKGPETEASSFRNANICDKRVVEDEIRYGVVFGIQKHLPSRVMKSVVDVEKTQDGKEKYWFSELRIPLYLIKEYEEKMGKDLPSANKPTRAFTQNKPLRAPCIDIFSYLVQKRDGNDKYCCASCQADVPFRYAVKCNTCQGFCHEHCTVSSTVDTTNTCKQCNQNRALSQAKCSDESPTSPLLLQGQYFPKPISANKGVNVGNFSRPPASIATLKHSSVKKHDNSSNSTAKTKRNLGVIWRKKNEETSADFRLRNILLKGNPDGYSFITTCHLCRKPYDPDLMYIRCETCSNWFHADAVGLEESKVFEVMGFKCSRCRRTRIPICPYLDPESKKQLEEKRTRSRASKIDNPGMEFGSGMISELHMDDEMSTQVVPSNEDNIYLEDDNSLPFSTSEEFSEQFPDADCEWNSATMSVLGPKKLPVRRHVKNENDMDSSFASNPSHADFFGGNIMISAEDIPANAERGGKLPVRRNGGIEKDADTPFANNPTNVELSTPLEVEWDTSRNGFEEGMMFEFDDMEFEPQTYFSFNELLASDDCGPPIDGSANLTENVDSSLGFPSDGLSDMSYFQHEHALSIDSAAVTVPCKMCSHSEPCPDLCCQMCGIWIHSHCSPWVEESFGEAGWWCGSCREWR
ncbi:DDT domain-containing protein PTM-like [Lycium barbarum]|uniref:DDT domain-containing protein PTM-like n=1 Tax=Lycium barbarum TaxID=112863 RepID=UPI00293F0C83|nr:DDT domain-containing protein PTM-like [Lycium barbarum]XP_060169721.1 DDT domain-containing protein PTM-like [Lycium barbarum]